MRQFYLLFLLFCCHLAHSQTNYELIFAGDDYRAFIKHPKTTFKDSTSAAKYLVQFRNTALQDGFLLLSIDTIQYTTKSAQVTLNVGPKFSDAEIDIDPKELAFITRHSSLNEKTVARLPVSPSELARDLERIFNVYVNNGYPFAEISLKKIAITGSQLSAELSITRGPLCTWKEVNVRGDSTISSTFISNIIQIHVGDLYNESSLRKLSQRIKQISFLEELKPYELLFTPDGVELFVYVKSIPISSINGIIGFQPNPTTQKLAFTGEVHLKLLNVLNRGELLDIKWQSIRDQTQSLNSRFNYPFLFKTPFGLDGNFDLYKRDTSFLELSGTAGVQYFLSKGSYLKAFYQRISSSVLSGGKNNPQFSKLGSTASNSYGLAYSRQQVDYLPNPSTGIHLLFSGSAGSRSAQLTDTSKVIKSLIYRSNLDLSYFIPIARRHVLRLGAQTELYAAEEIFENELYRFGGLSAQRGFNEDELFATARVTGTLEYRFLLDRNSHVFAFYDQTWYENNASAYYNDTPFGVGAGFSFSTNLGVFSISYALGKQFDNPVLISNSKVHFGYIAYF